MPASNLAPVVVIMGRAGSGKTSTAEVLARKSPVPVIIFGGYIRKEIRANTEIGQRAQHSLETQGFVPTDIYLNYLQAQMRASPEKFRNGFIVEAFPRSIFQVEEFNRFLKSNGMRLAHLYLVNVSHTTSAKRIRVRSQHEGKPDVLPIEQRNVLFEQHANRLLAYYGSKGMVSGVNGNHLPVKRMLNFFLHRHKSLVHAQHRSLRVRQNARRIKSLLRRK